MDPVSTPFADALADPEASVAVDRRPEAADSPVLVLFGGLGNDTGRPPFEFVRLTADFGVHRVFLRDLEQCWYQRGLSGVCRDVPATVDALNALLESFGPVRRVFVGTSSGGFAAILFGVLCGADAVVAFSPQATITRWGRLRARDRRWPTQVAKARRSALHRGQLDLVRFLAGRAHRSAITVHFGDGDPMDSHYAEWLAACPGVEAVAHPGGHLVIRRLRERGEAAPLLHSALFPD